MKGFGVIGDVPVLKGDGVHDDAPALQAYHDGKPWKDERIGTTYKIGKCCINIGSRPAIPPVTKES